jgi:hypothetical protein
MSRIQVILASLLVFVLWGCSQGMKQSAATGEEPSDTYSASADSAPEPIVTLVVPSGTELRVRLAHSVSSATNQSGDPFEAILDQDLLVDDQVVAPEGSTVTGQLTDVVFSGKVKGLAKMTLALRTLQVGDTSYSIESDFILVEAEGTVKEDAVKVGTAIGGDGAAAVLLTKRDEVEFEAEQEFQFQLVHDLEMK